MPGGNIKTVKIFTGGVLTSSQVQLGHGQQDQHVGHHGDGHAHTEWRLQRYALIFPYFVCSSTTVQKDKKMLQMFTMYPNDNSIGGHVYIYRVPQKQQQSNWNFPIGVGDHFQI